MTFDDEALARVWATWGIFGPKRKRGAAATPRVVVLGDGREIAALDPLPGEGAYDVVGLVAEDRGATNLEADAARAIEWASQGGVVAVGVGRPMDGERLEGIERLFETASIPFELFAPTTTIRDWSRLLGRQRTTRERTLALPLLTEAPFALALFVRSPAPPLVDPRVDFAFECFVARETEASSRDALEAVDSNAPFLESDLRIVLGSEPCAFSEVVRRLRAAKFESAHARGVRPPTHATSDRHAIAKLVVASFERGRVSLWPAATRSPWNANGAP